MKTSELLEELKENLLRDVSKEATDSTVASLWSDAQLVRYLDDAQNKMARRTECILDGETPKVAEIVLVEGEHTYKLDSRIIRVIRAKMGGDDERALKETSMFSEFDASEDKRSALPLKQATPDRVTYWSMDVGTDKVRFYATPNADENEALVQLYVSRLPLNPLVSTEPDRVPEVPLDYHLDLVEWAAFRALRNHDVDGENIQKANIHRAAFDRAVQELKQQCRHKYAPPARFGGRVPN